MSKTQSQVAVVLEREVRTLGALFFWLGTRRRGRKGISGTEHTYDWVPVAGGGGGADCRLELMVLVGRLAGCGGYGSSSKCSAMVVMQLIRK